MQHLDSNIGIIKAPTMEQMKNVYNTVGVIVDNLDDIAMNEILSGSLSDVDDILNVIVEETHSIIYNPVHIKSSYIDTFDYLDKFTSSFEETMRKEVFNYFTLTVLPRFELSPHIIEWGNIIQLYQRFCIIAARGHAKSHTLSYANSLWKLYRYSNNASKSPRKRKEYSMCKSGMLITNEIGLAKHLLSKVKEEIEANEILREVLYPEDKEGWKNEAISCKNGSSLITKSYGSKMRGYHPTFIIVDDFLNESVLYSAEQREKYNTHFHSVIVNMIMKGGQIGVIGTPFVDGDLYDDLKKKSGWSVFEYPAIFPDGKILWETEHTYESLSKLKDDIGSVNFSREILVKPITGESSVFPYKYIQEAYAGMGEYTLVSHISNHPKRGTFTSVICGMDFALSADSGADYTVFCVIAIDDVGRYWLIHVYRGKGIPYDQQIAEANRINQDFSPDIFVVETNGAQKIFADALTNSGINVLEHHTGVDKHSLKEGVPALAILFEKGMMRLPRGDQKSKDITDLLTSQLTSVIYDPNKGQLVFTVKHDDDAMAFWQACRGARYYQTGSLSFSFL